jgi:Zn-dependent M28 family amino/carboxypeptidase
MHTPSIDNIKSHLQTLVGERNPYSTMAQLQQTGHYLKNHFQGLNLEVREETVPFVDNLTSQNILATKKGSDPEAGIFVIAAHYDSVEGSPGADDNASAVAALLEIARCLDDCQFRVPLVFAGFTLEEYGFVGSEYFIKQSLLRKEKIRGMISLEMLGYRDSKAGSQQYPPYMDPTQYPDRGDFIAIVGNEPSAGLTMAIKKNMLSSGATSLPVEHLVVPGSGADFTEVRLSDHSPFWDHGIPAVMITDTAFFRNPHYHQATDTLETLDIEFIQEVTQGVLGFLNEHLT